MVLQKLDYDSHQWLICVDLKMVNLLLGQQSGYTKYPCFICLWDSRARDDYWVKKKWPPRDSIRIGEANVINEHLLAREKIIIPTLLIKLSLMKQFVKILCYHTNAMFKQVFFNRVHRESSCRPGNNSLFARFVYCTTLRHLFFTCLTKTQNTWL